MEERYHAFTLLIASLNRNIRRIKTDTMTRFHLKSQHVSCIYYLYRAKSLTATELCEISGQDKANLSRSVDYLEKNGFLVCKTKEQKRYKSPLELTPMGDEVGRYLCARMDEVLSCASEGLSEENRQIMYDGLATINENLRKIHEQYTH